ncbi:SGNH/GDSL hydrolase family protein [Streptomyces sp. M19]
MADDSKRWISGGIGSYAAVGDSFTEGVGDPGPDGCSSAGRTGWPSCCPTSGPSTTSATPTSPYAAGFWTGSWRSRYRAPGAGPDLVTFCAGGNDILRPGSDPDLVAERYEAAVAELRSTVPVVLVCTGFDTRGVPVLRHLRGKIATYTAHVRAIADRHDCPVLDLWSLRSVQDRRAWDDDRLHLSADGHTRVALRAAQVLGLDVPADPDQPWPDEGTRSPRRCAGTTSTGPASIWCPGSGGGCAASPPVTTWSPSGRICCRCSPERGALPYGRALPSPARR